jgi:DNA-binding NarL/FixJ family response regulator
MKIYTRKADKANVLEMKTQGKNYTEIAEELKLSKQ